MSLFGGANSSQFNRGLTSGFQQQQQPQSTMGFAANQNTIFGNQTTGFGGQTTGFGGQTSSFGGQTLGFGGQTNSFTNQQTTGFSGQTTGFGGGFSQQQTTQQSSLFGGQGQGQIQSTIQDYKQEQNEVSLPHQFQDSISDIKSKQVQKGVNYLAVSSWDGQIQVYQVDSTPQQVNTQIQGSQPPKIGAAQSVQTQGPILGICWQADVQVQPSFSSFYGNSAPQQISLVIYIAHSDGTIKRWEINSGQQPTVIGQHTQPVKDVASFTMEGQVFLVSAGWDSMVKFWKITGSQVMQIGEQWLGKPIHAMSCQFPMMITSHSERFVHIWNLNNMRNNQFAPIHIRESPLKYQTSSISCFADGQGYAIGSIEGRCGIVNVDLSKPGDEDQRDFCFKCHRQEEKNSLTGKTEGDVYTVNSISFNKEHNTFGTAGNDGQYIFWNKDSKSKYKSSQKSSLPITVGCFSEDATIFAFAFGEDWTLGGNTACQRQNLITLYVRKCDKEDVFKPAKR